jgi:hypothetical protein
VLLQFTVLFLNLPIALLNMILGKCLPLPFKLGFQ